jgi:hypothetical protein
VPGAFDGGRLFGEKINMGKLTVILARLFSAIIVILMILLAAEVLFVLRHGYFFRAEDIFSFISGK